MTLSVFLTNSKKVKGLFSSNNFSILDEIYEAKNDKLTNLDKEIYSDLSLSSRDLIKEMLSGKYQLINNEYNFYYGLAYGILCECFGETIDEAIYYNDNDVNFIYDKFPKDILKKKYYFQLPQFDFPDFISLEKNDIELLQTFLNKTVDYKTEYINLQEVELEKLKNGFQQIINISIEKQLDIVFRIDD
jgi:hypothetical protein